MKILPSAAIFAAFAMLLVSCVARQASVEPLDEPVTVPAPKEAPSSTNSHTGTMAVSPTPKPTADPAPDLAAENSYLSLALAMIPGDATRFSFTHWRRLKQYHHVPDLTSKDDRSKRNRFMRQVLDGSQAAAAMDKTFFLYQAKNWGWDSTDLVWEAEGQFERLVATVHLLRFRPDYDFAPVEDLLQSLSFEKIDYDGVIIYSTPLGSSGDWEDASPLAHHNIAILAEEQMLVMSPVLESVQHALDTWHGVAESLADRPRVQRVAFWLEGMSGVEIQLGNTTCLQFSPGYQFQRSDLGASRLAVASVQAYPLLAAGHAFNNNSQRDLLLIHYEDSHTAETDFATRQALITDGISPFRNMSYSKQFVLENAVREDMLLIFTLAPSPTLPARPGWPQTMIGWIDNLDALFLSCQE